MPEFPRSIGTTNNERDYTYRGGTFAIFNLVNGFSNSLGQRAHSLPTVQSVL